jgi:hypothetical protein
VRGAGLTILPSPLEGVSDGAWTTFADRMRTQAFGAVSPSNAIGAWALKPRRLADLGLVAGLSYIKDPKDPAAQRNIFVGEFIPPRTTRSFQHDPKDQYIAFSNSMKDYHQRMQSGDIPSPDGGVPAGMTVAGALSILHRGGPAALQKWNDLNTRFEDTQRLYSDVNGIF